MTPWSAGAVPDPAPGPPGPAASPDAGTGLAQGSSQGGLEGIGLLLGEARAEVDLRSPAFVVLIPVGSSGGVQGTGLGAEAPQALPLGAQQPGAQGLPFLGGPDGDDTYGDGKEGDEQPSPRHQPHRPGGPAATTASITRLLRCHPFTRARRWRESRVAGGSAQAAQDCRNCASSYGSPGRRPAGATPVRGRMGRLEGWSSG